MQCKLDWMEEVWMMPKLWSEQLEQSSLDSGVKVSTRCDRFGGQS